MRVLFVLVLAFLCGCATSRWSSGPLPAGASWEGQWDLFQNEFVFNRSGNGFAGTLFVRDPKHPDSQVMQNVRADGDVVHFTVGTGKDRREYELKMNPDGRSAQGTYRWERGDGTMIDYDGVMQLTRSPLRELRTGCESGNAQSCLDAYAYLKTRERYYEKSERMKWLSDAVAKLDCGNGPNAIQCADLQQAATDHGWPFVPPAVSGGRKTALLGAMNAGLKAVAPGTFVADGDGPSALHLSGPALFCVKSKGQGGDFFLTLGDVWHETIVFVGPRKPRAEEIHGVGSDSLDEGRTAFNMSSSPSCEAPCRFDANLARPKQRMVSAREGVIIATTSSEEEMVGFAAFKLPELDNQEIKVSFHAKKDTCH